MGIPVLRQDIDAMTPLAPIGNGVQICSVYNFQILFCGFFFLFAAHRLMTQDDSVRQRKNIDLMAAFRLGHCLFILLYWGGNGNT
jgi:hypothetical protein